MFCLHADIDSSSVRVCVDAERHAWLKATEMFAFEACWGLSLRHCSRSVGAC